MKKLMLNMMLAASLTIAAQGQAQSMGDHGRGDRCLGCPEADFETTTISGSMTLDQGETETVSLYGWKRVQKLFIQAESRYGGTFEVVVNGDSKGTVYVPAMDPSYVVTIAESTNSIQLRHISGGSIYIRNIKSLQSVRGSSDGTGGGIFSTHTLDQGAALARRAIQLVDSLERYANYNEYGTYLLPIKKAAARAYATTTSRGDLSRHSRVVLKALQGEIEASRQYLGVTFERDAAFECAVALLTVSEKLDDLMD